MALYFSQPAEVGSSLRTGRPAVVTTGRALQRGLAEVLWPTKMLPEVMGGDTVAQPALIREYLFISLFWACAESLVSENASRLAAMERADKNIDELPGTLHGTFHRIRQAGIGEELFEVISNFEALSKGKSEMRRHSDR